MKKIILFFCCFLAVASVTLNAQEIRPMPADSAYGVVHISVCNLRDEGEVYLRYEYTSIVRNAG